MPAPHQPRSCHGGLRAAARRPTGRRQPGVASFGFRARRSARGTHMMRRCLLVSSAALTFGFIGASGIAHAQDGCKALPDYARLKAALIQATVEEASGLNNQMWGTI